VRERRGSVSLLQRCLGIGYGRAARLIDYMAEDGIVGEYNGSQAREVAISIEDWEAMASANKAEANGEAQAAAAAPASPHAMTAANVQPKQRRVTKILPGSDEPSDLEEEPTPAKGRALRLGRDEEDEIEEEESDEADEAEDDETPWEEEDEAAEGDEEEEAVDEEEWDEAEVDEDGDEEEGDDLWDEEDTDESEWDKEEDELDEDRGRAAS
jgi:S-DNA-T family DNA segregation ATPase FtsK/SpoIIIE